MYLQLSKLFSATNRGFGCGEYPQPISNQVNRNPQLRVRGTLDKKGGNIYRERDYGWAPIQGKPDPMISILSDAISELEAGLSSSH